MEKGNIDVLGSRERKENQTFVVLTANLVDGEHRYITFKEGTLISFESAEVATQWAQEREVKDDASSAEANRVVVMQVPQKVVIDKAIAEDKPLVLVTENGEAYKMRYEH